ncbi:MAG: hypothetical protein OXH92_02510, partial [Bryobacterales bacterium]|nr:hypothetical protein [Bryobacterales bacterium]
LRRNRLRRVLLLHDRLPLHRALVAIGSADVKRIGAADRSAASNTGAAPTGEGCALLQMAALLPGTAGRPRMASLAESEEAGARGPLGWGTAIE